MTITSTSFIKKLLLLFLVVAGLYYARVFLIPLSIAGILATLFLPFCIWMENKKIPKGLSPVLCLLVLLLIIAGIGALLTWQITDLTKDFSLLTQRAEGIGDNIQKYIFNTFGITAKKQLQLLSNEQLSITGTMQVVAGSVASMVTEFILVMAYIFLLLYFRSHIRKFILKLVPPAQQTEMGKMLTGITFVSQQYLVGLAKMIACLWIMYGIGFSIIGVKNALFFAILCGLLEIVPFIGNLTGTSLTVLVSVVQGAGMPMVISIVATYLVVQFIQEWILSPIIVGTQVKINAFTTIIAMVLGELVWGVAGIFLAIPLIAMFKIICDHIESLKPYGFLIGEIESPKKAPGFITKTINRLRSKKK
jgi:predicted PurR-regulated permease PerM